MTVVARPINDLAARGRIYWLPRRGTGNGLDAAAWALILAGLDPCIVDDLLDILSANSVPAFASTPPPWPGPGQGAGVQLWVDSTLYSPAEDILMSWFRSPAANRSPRRQAKACDGE